MIEMKNIASASIPASEFNDFLFAPIGEERNGMLLSVLSALARQDVDPWEEAAKLARLPGEAATGRLAALIAMLPDAPSAFPEPRTIATRLIALLPRQVGPNGRPPATLLGIGAAINPQSLIFAIIINLVFTTLLLGAEFLLAEHQPSGRSYIDGVSFARGIVPRLPKQSFER